MQEILRKLWSGTGWPWRVTRFLLLFAILFTGFIMIFEKSFIYHPTPYPQGNWDTDALSQPTGGHRWSRQ